MAIIICPKCAMIIESAPHPSPCPNDGKPISIKCPGCGTPVEIPALKTKGE